MFVEKGNKSCVMDGIITKCPKIRNKWKVKARNKLDESGGVNRRELDAQI